MAGDTSTATETRLGKYQVLQRDYDPTECWAVVAHEPYETSDVLVVCARKQEAERLAAACTAWWAGHTARECSADEYEARHPLFNVVAKEHPAHDCYRFRRYRVYEVERLPFRW